MSRRRLNIGASAAATLLLWGAAAAVSNEPSGFVRITPDQLIWKDVPNGHGAQQAIVSGDPSKPGLYVVRAKFPPFLMDAPHWHPNARYVTVLQGTWYTGTGDVFDVRNAVALKAGSFMLHPAKAVHWDGSAGNETVIVQIVGMGPADVSLVNPAQSMWIPLAH